MLRILVCVSGGGTNLQAVIDAIGSGSLTNTEIIGVISNNKNAYALTRAEQNGIDAVCVSPKDFPDREAFNRAFLEKVNEYHPDLIVLAGFLVAIPAAMIESYRNRIINIHPSLIPSFCGVGFYGLKVHEAALARGVRNGYRPDNPAEERSGASGRYTEDASAACDGGSRMAASASGD